MQDKKTVCIHKDGLEQAFFKIRSLTKSDSEFRAFYVMQRMNDYYEYSESEIKKLIRATNEEYFEKIRGEIKAQESRDRSEPRYDKSYVREQCQRLSKIQKNVKHMHEDLKQIQFQNEHYFEFEGKRYEHIKDILDSGFDIDEVISPSLLTFIETEYIKLENNKNESGVEWSEVQTTKNIKEFEPRKYTYGAKACRRRIDVTPCAKYELAFTTVSDKNIKLCVGDDIWIINLVSKK